MAALNALDEEDDEDKELPDEDQKEEEEPMEEDIEIKTPGANIVANHGQIYFRKYTLKLWENVL